MRRGSGETCGVVGVRVGDGGGRRGRRGEVVVHDRFIYNRCDSILIY